MTKLKKKIRRPLDPNSDKSRQIAEDYKNGAGIEELAEKNEVHIATIYKHLRLHGLGTSLEDAKVRRAEGMRQKRATGYAPPPKYAWHLEWEKSRKK